MGEILHLSPAASESLREPFGARLHSGVGKIAQRKDFSGSQLKCEANGHTETAKDAGRETCGPRGDS